MYDTVFPKDTEFLYTKNLIQNINANKNSIKKTDKAKCICLCLIIIQPSSDNKSVFIQIYQILVQCFKGLIKTILVYYKFRIVQRYNCL